MRTPARPLHLFQPGFDENACGRLMLDQDAHGDICDQAADAACHQVAPAVGMAA